MTDLRQAAQQVLHALEVATTRDDVLRAIHALRAALKQKAEAVSHAVIAGALFDFMGWLTTRKERLVLSSTDNASPAADAIKDFAEMRGLLLDDAKVQDWQAYTTPPQQQAEPVHGDIRALKYRIHELEGEVIGYKRMLDVAEAAPQRKPLTEPELHAINPTWPAPGQEWGYEEVLEFARAIEAAHGIKEGT